MYIAIEGIDKAGKTSLMRKLKEKVEGEYLKEPTPALTDFIGRVKTLDHPDEKEILINLFAADRLLLKPIIEKAQKEDKKVFTDRSKFSSFAYQGFDLFPYNQIVNKNMPDPDVVFYLRVSPEESEKRGHSSQDKFEDKEFLESVVKMFEGPIRLYCIRNDIQFVDIDGTKTEEEIYEKVVSYLGGLI